MNAADLRFAAQMLRTLASAEQARLAEDYQEHARLLDPVDPIDVMATAAMLEMEATCRGGAPVVELQRPGLYSIKVA